MSDEVKKEEAKTIIIDNNPNKILQSGILDVGIARFIPNKPKVEFKPVELTPELVKQMSTAEMLDYTIEVEDGLPKKIKRLGDDVKDIEEIENDLAESTGTKEDIAPEINLDSANILHEGMYEKWDKVFMEALTEVSREYKLPRALKTLMWKERINGWLWKCHIPNQFRFSTDKESEVIRKVLQEIVLRVNGWDDKSIEQIEEMRKNCSIEGIRKNLPCGMKLWGFNSVGIAG